MKEQIWQVFVGVVIIVAFFAFSAWYTQGDACGSRESCAEETYSGQTSP